MVIVDEITVYATILDNIDLNNINSTVSWIDIGSKGLPNVGITDIVYSNTDDLLLISLHGRGVWKCLNFNKVFTTMNNQLLKSSYSIKDIIKPKYDNIGIGIIRPRESLDIIGNIRLGNNELLSTNIVPGIINSDNNFENFNGNNGKVISLSENINTAFSITGWVYNSNVTKESVLIDFNDESDANNDILISWNLGDNNINK